MNDQNHTDWRSPVTFDISHATTCPCCDGTGPTEYMLVIHPGHLEGARVGVVRG
jgi:hypothetical protein